MPEIRQMPVQPQMLRVATRAKAEGVDREAKVIRGMVVAQEGAFKTPGRGEFDLDGLKRIVQLGNAKPKGLKSHFAHPTLSDDGLGKMLGRARDFRMSKASIERDGRFQEVNAVRGDLHFTPSAFKTPSGDLATYVMDLAETDSDGISSSLQILPTELFRKDKKGKPLADEKGNALPPIWIPEKLYAIDIVNEGDAVDGLLSANLSVDALPDAVVRRGAELLDRVFAGQSREVIESRAKAWLARYLTMRFGGGEFVKDVMDEMQEPSDLPTIVLKTHAATPALDARRDRLDQMALDVRKARA